MKMLALASATTLLLGGMLIAQDKGNHSYTDKASASRGKGDARDPNIKNSSDLNKENPDIPAPPKKGGTARAAVCQVHVDNRTAFVIKIFIDGTYRGAVGPWGDAYAYTLAGATTMYGRADFVAGGYLSWGPRVTDCYGVDTWTLTP